MEKIPLEDLCEDIVGKAQRGLGISDDELAKSANIPLEKVAALRRGGGDEASARAVAPVLGLDRAKLVASLRKNWYPEIPHVEDLFMFNEPYHDMRVNAYLLRDPKSNKAAIFDTGARAEPMLTEVERQGLTVERVFLTHGHTDHVMELPALRRAFPEAMVHIGEREHAGFVAERVAHGDRFRVGGLSVEARLTWGHTHGGVTYVVRGGRQALAFVGDAIFAGSMGGGLVSYDEALRANRREILSLADDTVLCPGHGPLTTVGQEKAHNPFF